MVSSAKEWWAPILDHTYEWPGFRFRDDYTRQHSERVAALALQRGRELGMASDRLELLRLAALVHDVGKIGVPDDVLFKPDDLTAAERSVIERHPPVAAEILSRISGTQEIAVIVIAHHECSDGSGYPRGQRAEDIPPEAATLRVNDVFCALTDKCAYQQALDAVAALALMLPLKNTKFDEPSLEGAAAGTGPRGHVERSANGHPQPTTLYAAAAVR